MQDFIAAARRSRDLWYGSRLLSELAATAARKVEELSPGSLISPGLDLASTPNIILALGDLGNKALQKIEQAVRAKLLQLANDALDQAKGQFDRRTAAEQIADLPEIYWVSLPIKDENDEAEFIAARDQAMQLMAARKTTRNFQQKQGTEAEKSSIDGARECVIDKDYYSKTEKEPKIKALYDDFHAHQGERLSGVDLMKRLGRFEDKEKDDFPSTSHFAAQPFMTAIGDDITNRLVSRIRKLLEGGIGVTEADEGSLLFEGRLVDYLPDATQGPGKIEAFNAIFKDEVRALRPGAYYAILAADGDNMGIIVDSQSVQKRRQLSGALGDFSTKAKGIIQKQRGRAIYSGGDDFLAFLPLDSALACAAELEQGFRDATHEFPGQKDGKNIYTTLRIGIAIAHHLEPLSDVLRLAREAEKTAKDPKYVPQKNGLAIILSKRGGADRTIAGPWSSLHSRLSAMTDWMAQGDISSAASYDLRALHHRLSGVSGLEGGMVKEAVRIIGRKRREGGSTEEDPKLKGIKQTIRGWLEEDKVPVGELANELIIASAFASARISFAPSGQEPQGVAA